MTWNRQIQGILIPNMTIKNLWSLSIDEAITAERIKHELGPNYEIFFPVNSHLKDIDLIIFNLKSGKCKTVQVKGSRTYGSNNEQYAWITVKEMSILKPTNKTDFFIFVWHVAKHISGKRSIEQAYIVIPTEELQKKCRNEKTKRKNGYNFVFWTDLKKSAFDYPAEKKSKAKEIDFSKYLNNFRLLK